MVAANPSLTLLAGTTARSRRRKLVSGLMTTLIVGAFVVVLVPLVLVVIYVISKGAHVMSWSFLTSDIPIVDIAPGGGMEPAIVGTLVITAGATALAVPLGVLGAVYLNEYGGPSRLAAVIRFVADVMTGVPSIVMGLFIYTFWVLGQHKGLNGFSGSLALAALMLPIIVRTTEEMLRLVPDELREASMALGGRKAGTIFRVVLPSAAAGIVSGALLAIARAAGETAPLLFTIGITTSTNTSLFNGTNTSLSAQIFRNAQSPFVHARDRAWGAALTLILLVFLFTILARIVTALFARRNSV